MLVTAVECQVYFPPQQWSLGRNQRTLVAIVEWCNPLKCLMLIMIMIGVCPTLR